MRIPIVGLLLLLLVPCFAWGPVSHMYFASLAHQTTTFQGSDAPDGLGGFTSPQFSYAPFASSCPTSPLLHDPVMAATLLQQARSAHRSDDDAYESFLISYMNHMVGDLIGFHAGGGYLTNNKTRTRFGAVNWTLLWPKMQLIDAFITAERLSSPLPPVQAWSASLAARFTADVNGYFTQRSVPGWTNYTAEVLQECSNEWVGVQNVLLQYYREALAINGTYQGPLLFFDNQVNATMASSAQRFDRNAACAAKAITTYTSIITEGVDPPTAFQQLQEQVNLWFAQGMC